MRLTRPSGRRRAAAAVEFAFCSMPMVLLLAGLWEVGQLIDASNVINNAAREGGRQAATGARSPTEVEDFVKGHLTKNGITYTGMTFELVNLTNPAACDPRGATQMDQFRLHIRLPFENVRWALIPQITSATEMTSTVHWYSMRDIPLSVTPSVPSE